MNNSDLSSFLQLLLPGLMSYAIKLNRLFHEHVPVYLHCFLHSVLQAAKREEERFLMINFVESSVGIGTDTLVPEFLTSSSLFLVFAEF